MSGSTFQTLVGLEIHVQLATQSKLFCSCATQFGAEPNTLTCPVCAGFPGALPVLNQQALRLAIKTGLALNCQIERETRWDRKNYFYPDLPKGYQISQFDRPVCFGGWLEFADARGEMSSKRIRIIRAHLEEDAGKSLHDESGAGGVSLIDLNRAGTPLLEIVTHPDLNSGEEARDFLNELKLILTTIAVSECNMQKGELRCDANVNLVDPKNGVATPIVEIKNLNSFRAVERAVEFEAARQAEQYRQTGQTSATHPKQTRGWDDVRQQTTLQREKEESADYRYFPDPDLVAIQISRKSIDEIAGGLEPLPAESRRRLQKLGLSPYDANVLVRQGAGLLQFFDTVWRSTNDAKLANNWIQREVVRFLNERDCSIELYPVSAHEFSRLLLAIEDRHVNANRAKDILNCMVDRGIDMEAARQYLGVADVSQADLRILIQQIITSNPLVAADIRAGNAKAIGSLIGQARNANPNANPSIIREMLHELLGLH